MNTQEMITIMQLEGGAKIVRAKYLQGRPAPVRAPENRHMAAPWMDEDDDMDLGYCFKNVLGIDLVKGDLIVAETRDTFELLEVTNPDVMATDVGCSLGDLKHVVSKVRNDDYMAAKQQEHEAHRKLALSEVTSKLDTYRKQVGDGTFTTVAGLLGMAPSAEDGHEVIEDEEL